jgi:hypothetical protein
MITMGQMGEQITDLPLDPSDFNVRMWISWNEFENTMWFAAEVFDNIHNIDFTDPTLSWQNDDWEIMVDADHSGGQYNGWSGMTEERRRELSGRQAQQFILVYPSPAGFPIFQHYGTATFLNDRDPYRRPDLANWGVSYEGDIKGEGTTRYEVMLALWDELDWRGPEVSKRHFLKPYEIIGIQFSFADFDESSTEYHAYWTLSKQEKTFMFADRFTDVELIPQMTDSLDVEKRTTLEVNTWGRIKAGFAR